VASRVEGKIQIINGPVPPSNLWQIVDELERAATAEDIPRISALLQAVVPTFHRDRALRTVETAASF
jgi:hypothetical protein